MKTFRRRAGTPLVRTCVPALLLFALLFSGCDGAPEAESPPDAPSTPTPTASAPPVQPTGEETLTSVLDRDGSDGYTGDLVLVYHPALSDAAKKTMGSLDGLVETTENRVPTREGTYLKTSGLYSEPDPFLTDAIRQADPCYELTGGDLWQVGFPHVFNVGAGCPDEMLFQVSAVGERCRVWSPVNPDYGPLEGLDPAYPDQLAREMDHAIPVLEQTFGPIPDIRGDGKMNILCFDCDLSAPLGWTDPKDIYDDLSVNGTVLRGNRLPIVIINTAPLIQGVNSDLSQLFYTSTVHEMAHSIYGAQHIQGGSFSTSKAWTFFTEFLAVAAQETVYPGSSISHSLPWWYSDKTVWEDLAADDAGLYLRDKNNQRQSGYSIFDWGSTREDYSLALLLAHFVENRGGTDAFAHLENGGGTQLYEVLSLIWEELGYEDYAAFAEDFLLSVLLHEEDGPYRLRPFQGYDPAQCGGEENPFSHLAPIITDKGIYIRPGGYAVVRPVGGVYYPPATAAEGLCYVGISWKAAG